jgi:hypothetical protein
MTLLSLIVTLVVVGVLLWLINTYIPMDGKIKNILNIVVVIVVVLWLLSAFGILNQLNTPIVRAANAQESEPEKPFYKARNAPALKRDHPECMKFETEDEQAECRRAAYEKNVLETSGEVAEIQKYRADKQRFEAAKKK